MKDDAVAPVVAAMLILAIVVTFFAAWNAYFIPSMKAQSEIGHLKEVETAFSHFSSDIEAAASLKRDLTFSRTLPLGGGAMAFDSLTSAGTLRVTEERKLLYTVTVTDATGDHEIAGRLVNFSYLPVSNYWVDQGYVWHYGYVEVMKGASGAGTVLSTPLSYPTIEDVNKSGTIRTLAESLISIDSGPWYNSSANCSHITLSAVTFHREPGATAVNGNGIGSLALAATVNETGYGVPETTSPDRLMIRVSRSVPEPFSFALFETCNKSFADIAARYPHNVLHTFQTTALYNETAITPVAEMLPFDITTRHIPVNVSVH